MTTPASTVDEFLERFDASETIQHANLDHYHKNIAVHKDKNATRVASCRWRKRWKKDTTEYNTVREISKCRFLEMLLGKRTKERDYFEKQLTEKTAQLEQQIEDLKKDKSFEIRKLTESRREYEEKSRIAEQKVHDMALLMRKHKIPGWMDILDGGDIPKVEESSNPDPYAFLLDSDEDA